MTTSSATTEVSFHSPVPTSYCVRLMGSAPFRGSLRLAWNESRQLQFALGEGEAI